LDLDLDLDLDWVKQEEKIIHMDQHNRREPMTTVNVFFVFVDCEDEVDLIITEKHDLVLKGEGSVLKKEKLLRMIQEKKGNSYHALAKHVPLEKCKGLTKYVFADLLVYNIDLEPHLLQNYLSDAGSPSFLKHMAIPDDVFFTPSVFIFHPLNGIYIFFSEKEKDFVLHPKPRVKLNFSPVTDLVVTPLRTDTNLHLCKSRKNRICDTDNNKTRKNINI
jgi:hypothetical protein